jgi:hypothetical protein
MCARHLPAALVAVLSSASCYRGPAGEGGDLAEADGDAGSEGGTTDGEPDVPPDELALGASDLRPLTDWEYANTVRDLFGPDVAADIEPLFGAIPTSRVEQGYSTMDRRLTAAHVDAHYLVAVAVAVRVSTDATLRAGLAPCLADAAPDDEDCAAAFIDAFGPRAYRRPLSDDERTRLLAAWSADADATIEMRVENVILYALMSPWFLYRPELGGDDLGDRIHRLSSFEVASRLSYLLWGSMPDDELFEAAADDALDGEGIRAQAERMLASPRARDGIARFAGEWLRLEDRPALAFSERFLDGLPTEGLRDDMMAEPTALAEHLVLDTEGTFADLFTTRTGFVSSSSLASIYGAQAGEGPVELAAARSGLLTRAALLLGSGDETHPIGRGAFVVKRVLCTEIVPPELPPEDLQPPPFDPDKTNRERWDEKTSPAACAACHAVINPPGFAAEGYDAIGRMRTEEEIVDPAGEIVNMLPVDTHASVQLDGQVHEVADLVELGAVLADSDEAARCFATQWFRYGHGRRELADDGEAIDAISPSSDPLREMLLDFVTAPEFRHVRIAE